LRERNILIAEDEMLTRNGLYKLLTRWNGFDANVVLAEDGEAALHTIWTSEQPFDVILTDIRMPKMNGLELLQRLEMENYGASMILLTGYADFEYARSALRLGALNYLLKPVAEDQLYKAVEEGLQTARDRRRQQSLNRRAQAYPELLEDDTDTVKNPHIREAIDYIDANLHLPLGVKDVADRIHLNTNYFSVLFKQETGISYSDYVARKRMRKAKEQLIRTDRKIYEIAELTGYVTASYFVKVFRELEGMTPKQFRDLYR